MADVTIERLDKATPEAVEQIAALLPQLSSRQTGIDLERLERVLATPGDLFVALADGVIVGMVQRVDVEHVVRMKCWIEDFVVDEKFRGQGIATRLLQAAIEHAPAEAASVNLTSKEARPESHRIYTKLGFALREDSTIWRLALPVE